MTVLRIAPPIGLLLALLVACGRVSGPTAEPSAEGEASAPERPDPATRSADATQIPAGAATLTPGGGPDPAGTPDVHSATDLEALLPDEVDGAPLTKFSYSGEDAAATAVAGLDDEFLGRLAATFGKTLDDASIAVATDAEEQIFLAAIHLDGVSGEEMLEYAVEDDDAWGTFGFEETTLGGKTVAAAPDGGLYLYGAGEVLFEIIGEPALAEDAISQLP